MNYKNEFSVKTIDDEGAAGVWLFWLWAEWFFNAYGVCANTFRDTTSSKYRKFLISLIAYQTQSNQWISWALKGKTIIDVIERLTESSLL